MNTTIDNIVPDETEYECIVLKDCLIEELDDVESSELEILGRGQDLLAKKDEDQCGNSTEEQFLLNSYDGQIYNCNNCNVTFTSVEDHIEQYHQNQVILIAVSADDDDNNHNESPYLLNIPEMESVTNNDVGTEIKDSTFNNDDSKSESKVLLYNGECMDEKGDLFTECKDDEFTQVYQCSQCSNLFSTDVDFNMHKCTAEDKYKCIHCSVSYNNSKSLCAHMKIHKNLKIANEPSSKPIKDSSTGNVICEICETVLASKRSLILHMRMHKPVKSRSVGAPVNQDSDSKNAQFFCFICNKWMHLEYKTAHEETHNGLVKFICNVCNKVFPSQEDLIMHSNAHSTDNVKSKKNDDGLNYECKYCGKKFAKPNEKVKHERVHTGEKPYSCEVCGKCFRVAYCLTVHLRTHTGVRPYVCKICDKRFKSFTVYSHHLSSHSNERHYKCPSCPKAFKTLVQLGGHKKSHTKPFQCTICNRPFSTLYAVKKHMSVHKKSNNMKFCCKYCGANYARFFALKDHIIQTHDVDKEFFDTLNLKEDFLISLPTENQKFDDVIIELE